MPGAQGAGDIWSGLWDPLSVLDEPDTEYIEIPLDVSPAFAGYRLDRFLATTFTRLSRTRIHKMIELERVCWASDQRPIKKAALRLKGGDRLLIFRPPPDEPDVVMDYSTLHIDEGLLVLDKPSGLPVHPSARYHKHTLTALMKERLGAGHGWEMAHRLDRETSGVMLFGRKKGSASTLKKSFIRRQIQKEYWAVVHGILNEKKRIEVPLGPAKGSKIHIKIGERAVDDGGVEALTDVVPLAYGAFRGEPITLVRAMPFTGRTHQIRVHLDHIGHPLVGDKLYGLDESKFIEVVEGGRPAADLEEELGFGRHALHARSIRLWHPTEGVPVEFASLWPPDLGELITPPDDAYQSPFQTSPGIHSIGDLSEP